MLEGIPEPLVDYECDLGLLDTNGNPWGVVLLNYSHSYPSEEPYLLITPRFAIYDYNEARDIYPKDDPQHDWSDSLKRRDDLDEFAEEFGIVFSFNRYTGTVIK